MSSIITLILPKFRKGAERAASWLEREHYDSIFLQLPRDMDNFLHAHMEGELSIDRFWRNYGCLTGFQQPFINAARYTIDPLLDALSQLHQEMPKHKIYCYQELDQCIEDTKLSERLLLLEITSRVRRRIIVEEWRTLLRDELEDADIKLRAVIENIAEKATAHERNIVLYDRMIKPFKKGMEAERFTVKAVYLQHYWRSPLEVLRVIAWNQGADNISDDMIVKCIQCHLRYLDHVLSSKDTDAAHERWTCEIRHS